MKYSSLLIILLAAGTLITACKSSPFGKRVKSPFEGRKYETNNRFFRAVGKGQSSGERIALQRANVRARSELAAQVDSRIKELADDYISETGYEDRAEVTGKFQSLTRSITDTRIAELRKIGERKFVNEQGEYTAFAAYEIKKKELYDFLEKQAEQKEGLTAEELKLINEMIEFERNRLEKEME